MPREGEGRIASIDVLRGLVMALMALDHTRDFFSAAGFNPRDVTEPALFLTRWVTHFCAPTFILLAGLSAFLYGSGRSVAETSRFLLIRGLWLIVIEFTIVRLGWTFDLGSFHEFTAGVIWVIGASMVALAALIWLPRWAIAVVALVMIAGHNLLDGVRAESPRGGRLALACPASTGSGASWRSRERRRAVPACPMDRSDGSGLCAGPGDATRAGSQAAALVQARRCSHPRFRLAPGHQSLWRPRALDRAGDVARDSALLPQLREISAVAALSDDDARARTDAACVPRACPWFAWRVCSPLSGRCRSSIMSSTFI